MVKDTDLAWLAGFWDGEGSVGLVKSKQTFILLAQLSHTEFDSVTHILALLEGAGVEGRGYTYQERDPEKHRDAHYIRVTGIANVMKLAALMVPHAVTKKKHWEIAHSWATRRIKVAGGIDAKGHLFRGGLGVDRGYSENEISLAAELSALNRRGPADRLKRAKGRIKT